MMDIAKPRIQDSYDPATEQSIERFEATCGIELPDSYKSLIKTHNGGSFNHFVMFDNGHDTASIEYFLALDAPFDFADLLTAYNDFRTHSCPKHGLLPIADDGLGNSICVNSSDGRVVLWDHERGSEIQVAADVNELLRGIRYSDEQQELWDETSQPFIAAERGDVAHISRVPDEKLNVRNDQSMTLLGCACASRQPQVVEALLSRGATIDLSMPGGKTALNLAAAASAFDVSKILIENGAFLDAQDDRGASPLVAALSLGAIRVAILLIESGADVNLQDIYGNSPRSLCIDESLQKYVLPLLSS